MLNTTSHQLGRKFIKDKDGNTDWQTGTPFDLDQEEALGLRLCSWPGRAQAWTHGCQMAMDFKIVCVWPFGLLDYGSATLRCKI